MQHLCVLALFNIFVALIFVVGNNHINMEEEKHVLRY
jgi:hypothetical protein